MNQPDAVGKANKELEVHRLMNKLLEEVELLSTDNARVVSRFTSVMSPPTPQVKGEALVTAGPSTQIGTQLQDCIYKISVIRTSLQDVERRLEI